MFTKTFNNMVVVLFTMRTGDSGIVSVERLSLGVKETIPLFQPKLATDPSV